MKKIVVVLSLFVLILTLSSCSGRDVVTDAKGLVFDGVNSSATLEEMVDVVIRDAQWSSEEVSDDLYNVTVTGIIQDDIPTYRAYSGQYFCVVLSVQYYNDQCRGTTTDGYFGDAVDRDPVSCLSSAYKIAAGITPESSILELNKETTNPDLPLFTIQQERRPMRKYDFSLTNDDAELYEHCEGHYCWTSEAVDAPNCVGYTLNSIALELYYADFSNLNTEQKNVVLELFNSGVESLDSGAITSDSNQSDYSSDPSESTQGYNEETSENPSPYDTGNAWDDFTVDGVTYEMAEEQGWGDEWLEIVSGSGSDYGSDGEDVYDESEGQMDTSAEGLSDSELIKINDPISSELAREWKNNYNLSVSRDFKIKSVKANTLIPTIERDDSIATVTTQIDYWLGGGSPTGSVYAIVTIDTYTGDVLTAEIL